MLLPALLCLSPQQALEVEPIHTGLQVFPLVQVTYAPDDDPSRIYVVGQHGDIRIFEQDVRLPAPFLDIWPKVQYSGERGLLGLAFHPNYAQNGYFYVNYSLQSSSLATVIERYSVDPNNRNAALPGSGQVILQIPEHYGIHNAGWMGFGHDGYLYVATGEDGEAQNGNSLLGKILRIDVDHPAPGLNYGIPPTNPFVGDPNVLDEIWALGLRNPWRCDFDGLTGDLWITDVGQSSWEEINFEPAGSGGRNYGWNVMEGNHCYNPPTGCNQAGLTLPIYEYDDGRRCSIIGGAVYRGRQMADMHGRFFFSDHCSRQTWSLRQTGGAAVDLVEHTSELLQPGGAPLDYPYSLCEDAQGEIYIVTRDETVLWRVVPSGLRLRMPELTAGSQAAVPVSGGTPNGMTGLFYSLTGLGSTVLPPAQVTLGIGQAKLIAVTLANAAGTATFSGVVPGGLQDRTVWLQAAQLGVSSNIAVETVD